ncbi:MAG: hypothetical protein NTZ27_04135 [Ignavibacteriales bacterium]|nr:hypothetical protein [Ignavibacteriales bacterium]
MDSISRRKILKISGFTIGAAAALSTLCPMIKGTDKVNKAKV